jgi:hypothetical protein
MKAMRFLAAALLAATLTGAGVTEPYPGHGKQPGPTCYGGNYKYHVWNLVAPQDVYGVDSCVAAQLVAQRNAAGNLAMYISLVSARVPVLVSTTVYVMAWNTTTQALAVCASPGTGVEFVQDAKTGAVLGCRAQ